MFSQLFPAVFNAFIKKGQECPTGRFGVELHTAHSQIAH